MIAHFFSGFKLYIETFKCVLKYLHLHFYTEIFTFNVYTEVFTFKLIHETN